MPVLNQNTNGVERLYLPSTKDLGPENPECAWVDMVTGPLTAGDILGIDPKNDDVSNSLQMLANRIKDWNYTDAGGAKLPVTFDNVKHLDMGDFSFLAEQLPQNIEGLETAEKKS